MSYISIIFTTMFNLRTLKVLLIALFYFLISCSKSPNTNPIYNTNKITISTTTPVVSVNDTIKLLININEEYLENIKKMEWKTNISDNYIETKANSFFTLIAPSIADSNFQCILRTIEVNENVIFDTLHILITPPSPYFKEELTLSQIKISYNEIKDNLIVFKGDTNRLNTFLKKIKTNKTLKIGFLGGSITVGAYADNNFLRYSSLVTKGTKSILYNNNIVEINAGLSGTGSKIALGRVEKDLLTHSPDILIIEFSVNDCGDPKIVSEAHDSLISVLKDYDEELLILYFCFMSRDGTSAQNLHQEFAYKYNIPMLSYRNVVWPLVLNNSISVDSIYTDNVHPNNNGHKLAAFLICNYLNDILNGRVNY